MTRTHLERTKSLRYTQNFHTSAVENPRRESFEGRKMPGIENAAVRAAVAEEEFGQCEDSLECECGEEVMVGLVCVRG